MLSFAALSINRFFTTAPKLERETPGNRTATLLALSDLGESVASSVHAIYAQSRLYLCVAMQPKPEALHAQRLADKKAAAGHFDVDAVLLHEDVRSHFRVPFALQVTEVRTGFQ